MPVRVTASVIRSPGGGDAFLDGCDEFGLVSRNICGRRKSVVELVEEGALGKIGCGVRDEGTGGKMGRA